MTAPRRPRLGPEGEESTLKLHEAIHLRTAASPEQLIASVDSQTTLSRSVRSAHFDHLSVPPFRPVRAETEI